MGLMTIGDSVVPRRTLVVLVLAVLTGCAQRVPATPTSPPTQPVAPTPGPTTGPTPEHASGPLRSRLANALRGGDPLAAGLVENAATDITTVETGWLPDWHVVDVNYRGVPHGRRFYVGLADDDRVLPLAGRPDAFAAMTAAARVEVVDARTATAVAQVCLDATRTFERYAYRVESVGDIQWLSQPTPQQQAERRRVERAYGSRIARPAAARQASGWALTLWTVDNSSLVEHHLVVSRAGQVGDSPRTVEPRLPAPESR